MTSGVATVVDCGELMSASLGIVRPPLVKRGDGGVSDLPASRARLTVARPCWIFPSFLTPSQQERYWSATETVNLDRRSRRISSGTAVTNATATAAPATAGRAPPRLASRPTA